MDGQAKSWSSRIARRFQVRGRSRSGDSSSTQERQDNLEAQRSERKLSKEHTHAQPTETKDEINELGEREYSVFAISDPATFCDHTDLMHGLSKCDSLDSLVDGALEHGNLDNPDPQMTALRMRREAQLSLIPTGIWETVAAYLSPADQAHLTLASKMFLVKLGHRSLSALDLPENQAEKIKFLLHLDRRLPDYLLCFVCAKYHRRKQPGLEKLPTPNSQNSVVLCTAATASVLSRTRLTHSRPLPYAFAQLTLRAARYGLAYGIPVEQLAREWKESGEGGQPQWRHSTRYLVKNGHLLLRVRSHAFAGPGLPPAGMRHILYEREEYMPYFSVCAHWADGELMEVCKCALSHVPETRPTGAAERLRRGPQAVVSSLVHSSKASARDCVFCQSARRCPRCPSEYLVKITMMEDAADQLARFKYAILVTRWVDLGNGLLGPGLTPEWDALNGVIEDYDSIGQVGRRSLMGVFESTTSGSVPNAGLVNMNLKNRTGGRDGD